MRKSWMFSIIALSSLITFTGCSASAAVTAFATQGGIAILSALFGELLDVIDTIA